MKETKYRFWNGDRMIYANDKMFELHWSQSNGFEYAYIGEGTGEWSIDIKKVNEFTGLKDKNGKEIYEGDIVTCGGGYEDGDGCEDYHKVEMIDGQWMAECIHECGSIPLYEFDINEVIGNIYENPELI
jgi:uncharacterized phage protein (TIGR01671 family)